MKPSNPKMEKNCFQIYDYKQMFDGLKLELALSEMYDAGIKDDSLALLYEANKEIHMAAKTPNGLSVRKNLKSVILQGDTWGSILASVTVDSISKECMKTGNKYLYKDVLPISTLGLVDDLIGITRPGNDVVKMKNFLNSKSAEKSLQ